MDGWQPDDDFTYEQRGPGLNFFRCKTCGHMVPAVRQRYEGERWRRLMDHATTHLGIEVRLG